MSVSFSIPRLFAVPVYDTQSCCIRGPSASHGHVCEIRGWVSRSMSSLFPSKGCQWCATPFRADRPPFRAAFFVTQLTDGRLPVLAPGRVDTRGAGLSLGTPEASRSNRGVSLVMGVSILRS